jgi:hypothetical protein
MQETKVKHLYHAWYGRPLEECEKPTTLNKYVETKAAYLGLKNSVNLLKR